MSAQSNGAWTIEAPEHAPTSAARGAPEGPPRGWWPSRRGDDGAGSAVDGGGGGDRGAVGVGGRAVGAMKLTIVPVNVTEARAFVTSYHRHNKAPLSGLFAIGVSDGTRLCGVAIVGRPVARLAQDGYTAEVTRVCVLDDAPKGSCSALYAAAWRAARAIGYTRLITYTLASESGASLRGAGWRVVGEVRVRKAPWHGPDRAREWQPVYGQARLRWEMSV